MRVQLMLWVSLFGVLWHGCAQSEEPQARRIDCLLVPNAQIASDESESKAAQTQEARLRAANSGHQIKKGRFYVLAVRQYQDDNKGVDSARFAKTTLQLTDASLEVADGQTRDFHVSDGYYSEGGVGFVHRGEYWLARNPISHISATSTTGGLTIRLQQQFVAKHASTGREKGVQIDLTCQAHTASVDSLGPWEGRAGTDWTSFAPAPESK